MKRKPSATREVIRQALYELERKKKLTPDSVIELARNKAHPLHPMFQWDIRKAALEHWRRTAREIISDFRVEFVVHETVYEINEFVERMGKRPKEQGYVSIGKLKDRKEEAAVFVKLQMQIAGTYAAKAIGYAAVLGMSGQIESLLAEINKLASEAERMRAAA